MAAPFPTPATPIAREWLEYLCSYEESLRGNPNQPNAWRRQIHVKVLEFLLRRYGDDPRVGGPHPYDLFAVGKAVPSTSLPRIEPDRRVSDLVPILRRIAQANQRAKRRVHAE